MEDLEHKEPVESVIAKEEEPGAPGHPSVRPDLTKPSITAIDGSAVEYVTDFYSAPGLEQAKLSLASEILNTPGIYSSNELSLLADQDQVFKEILQQHRSSKVATLEEDLETNLDQAEHLLKRGSQKPSQASSQNRPESEIVQNKDYEPNQDGIDHPYYSDVSLSKTVLSLTYQSREAKDIFSSWIPDNRQQFLANLGYTKVKNFVDLENVLSISSNNIISQESVDDLVFLSTVFSQIKLSIQPSLISVAARHQLERAKIVLTDAGGQHD